MSTEISSPFTVLTVCTGNICRSPAAERLLGATLGPSVRVASAGTGALRGRPIHPDMSALLERDGFAPDGFRARQVTDADVRAADLVLPLSRAHRAAVVDLVPSAVRRTFTILEFARILSTLSLPGLPGGPVGDRLRAALPLAITARSAVGSDPDQMDVPDPYGLSETDFEHAYALIRSAVTAIADAMAGVDLSLP